MTSYKRREKISTYGTVIDHLVNFELNGLEKGDKKRASKLAFG